MQVGANVVYGNSTSMDSIAKCLDTAQFVKGPALRAVCHILHATPRMSRILAECHVQLPKQAQDASGTVLTAILSSTHV